MRLQSYFVARPTTRSICSATSVSYEYQLIVWCTANVVLETSPNPMAFLFIGEAGIDLSIPAQALNTLCHLISMVVHHPKAIWVVLHLFQWLHSRFFIAPFPWRTSNSTICIKRSRYTQSHVDCWRGIFSLVQWLNERLSSAREEKHNEIRW